MGYRSLTSRLLTLERAQPALPILYVWLEDEGVDTEVACEAARRDHGLPPGTPVRFVLTVWEADGMPLEGLNIEKLPRTATG